MKEYGSYFEGNDVDDFLKEVSTLKINHEMIEITEVASLIRNDIELLAH
jgi:hypothetical protein